MRINLPVTQHEHPFPSGQTLVSVTDLKGRILYCNPGFIELSGFSKEELLGQPHNLVRHPDMPEEAYRDMWETIESGRPWSAAVKNRRKDGDHYWVYANATPLMQDGRPVGYMSVRVEATREQIEAAEALYAQMRREKEQGVLVHGLRHGRVIKHTVWGRLKERVGLDLGGRMWLGFAGVWVFSCLPLGLMRGEQATYAPWVAMGVGATTMVMLAIWLHRHAVAPLGRFADVINQLAGGDLTTTLAVEHRGVMGQIELGLRQMSVNLRSIVRDARTESQHMQLATAEIAAGNQDLSQRTESQASSLEQTAASMEEMTSTISTNNDSARQATALSKEALAFAGQGTHVVNDVAATMNEIQHSSQRIADITQLIDGIAFQTNILALNAAVEAARAGEAGRGFAVVASEVRTLAQRTSTAAKEIKGLIDMSVQQVHNGNQKTDEARRTIQNTYDKMAQVNTMIQEIAMASQEQYQGVSQINQAVSHLDGLTQQNAAMVEQIAASANALNEQANAVKEAVSVFRIDSTPMFADAVTLRRQQKALDNRG